MTKLLEDSLPDTREVCGGPIGIGYSAARPLSLTPIPCRSPRGPLQNDKIARGLLRSLLFAFNPRLSSKLEPRVKHKKRLRFLEASRAILPFCGERGIRTLDTLLRCTHFPGALLKPLGHLSFSPTAATFRGESGRKIRIIFGSPKIICQILRK